MKITKFMLLSFSILALVFLAACSSEPAETEVVEEDSTIKIGVMAPLTGGAASYGLSVQKGIELAAKQLNADVELIFEDSKCDGKEAVSSINKLIFLDEVHAIIGELCSGATLAVAPIAEENGVVLISAASTSPKISESGAYIFRTVPSDALQGSFGAKLVADSGYENLAILYSNEEYGVGFSDVLVESFEHSVVASEAFERDSVDMRTQLTKIKDAEPDAIYIISNSPDAAVAALKQIEELDIDAALYGSEGLKSPDIVEGAEGAAEGLILTSVSSGTTVFAEDHEEEFGEAPGPFAAQGYDAFQAIYLALGETPTRQSIRGALADSDFEGASGHIEFDENGDIAGNYDIFEVVDGEFSLVSE